MKRLLVVLSVAVMLLFMNSQTAFADRLPDDNASDITIEFDSDSTATQKNVTLSLFASDSSMGMEAAGEYNYKALRAALESADPAEKYTLSIKLKVASGGGTTKIIPLYTVSSGTLNIRSMTTIDLNGYTLLATGDSLMNTNMFNNSDYNGRRRSADGCTTGTKYNLSHDITIKNGTIDGNEKSLESKSNLVTFGHAKNITVEDVTFTHNAKNHLLEFSGCSDILVKNCTFDGYLYQHGDDEYEEDEYLAKEAVELDISGKGKAWAGSFDGDNTVCQNVEITGCTFLEFPCGVGDHHSISGIHASNIKITNNTFKYNGKEMSGSAIRTYNFDNCEISGNLIDGNYFIPIRIYGGKVVKVDNNLITKAEEDGIEVQYAYITGTTKTQAATEVTLTNNTVRAAKNRGIYVFNKSSIKTISNNMLTANGIGLSIYDSTVTGAINNNTIDASKGTSGIYMYNSSAPSITYAHIKAGQIGICLDKAPVKKLGGSDDNEIIIDIAESTGGVDGLRITGTASVVNEASYITINAPSGNGIKIVNGANVKSLSNTKVTTEEKSAVALIVTKAKLGTVTDSTFQSDYRSITIVNAGTVEEMSKLTVDSKDETALYVASKGVIKAVKNCNISSESTSAVIVSGTATKINDFTENTLSSPDSNATVEMRIASGGYVGNIKSNTIGTADAMSYIALRVTGKGSKVDNISGNSIYGKYKGLFVDTKGEVGTVIKNTVWASDANALNVATAGVVKTVGGNKDAANTFTSSKSEAIVISGSGTNVGELSYNTLVSSKATNIVSLRIATGATVGKVAYNTIGTKKVMPYVGLRVTGSAVVTTIEGNTVYAKYKGIYVDSKGKVDTIKKNTVTAKESNALGVATAGTINIVGGAKADKNTFTSTAKEAVAVSGKGCVINKFTYNKVIAKNKKFGVGVKCGSGGKVKTCKSNTYSVGLKKESLR